MSDFEYFDFAVFENLNLAKLKIINSLDYLNLVPGVESSGTLIFSSLVVNSWSVFRVSF